MLDPNTADKVFEDAASGISCARTPGEILLDHELVDRAVAALKHIQQRSGLDVLVAIGRCLLQHFFDGDISAYHAKNRRHISFRTLSKHQDLPYSASRLRLSIAVVEQLGQLPQGLGLELSVSHHRALLPITDVATKIRLAQQAREQDWSYRMLEQAVAELVELRPEGQRGGRPLLPEGVKQVRKLSRALTEPQWDDVDPCVLLDSFSPQELEQIRHRVHTHLRVIELALVSAHADQAQAVLDGSAAEA